jgi:transmembrane sensor
MAGNQNKMTYDEILLSKEFLAYTSGSVDEVKEYWDKLLENDIQTRNEFEKALKINELLASHKKLRYSPSLKENLLQQIFHKIDQDEKSTKRLMIGNWKSFVKIAASILLILGLSFIFSLVIYGPKSNIHNGVAFNEIIVPSGEKAQVILPDGTKIWLNSESRLRYPSVFAKDSRTVTLEGEAYFDVSKIKKSKFLVNTQGVKIEVLGTIFNVKSYPDEQTVETSVVEGKVKVDAGTKINPIAPVYILPSERAVFYKNNGKFISANKKEEKRIVKEVPLHQKPIITVGEVNIKNIICWKDYFLVFDNETFEEIAVKMARWYKIHVQINDEGLKKQRFTGKFINNETFYQVLEAINLTTPIEYKYERNELIVSPHNLSVFRRNKKPKI